MECLLTDLLLLRIGCWTLERTRIERFWLGGGIGSEWNIIFFLKLHFTKPLLLINLQFIQLLPQIIYLNFIIMYLLRKEIDPLLIPLVRVLLSHLGNLQLFFEHIHLLLIVIWLLLRILNLIFQHVIYVMQLGALDRRSLLINAPVILLEYKLLGLLVHEVHLMVDLDSSISIVFF